MERIKAHIFLVLILWVQFGSTGFVYYENVCSGSGTTSISLNIEGCCCESSNIENDYNHRNSENFNGKCCDTYEHFQQTSEAFPRAWFQFDFGVYDLLEPLQASIGIELLCEDDVAVHHSYNSVPIRNVDTRIFIQSFQI